MAVAFPYVSLSFCCRSQSAPSPPSLSSSSPPPSFPCDSFANSILPYVICSMKSVILARDRHQYIERKRICRRIFLCLAHTGGKSQLTSARTHESCRPKEETKKLRYKFIKCVKVDIVHTINRHLYDSLFFSRGAIVFHLVDITYFMRKSDNE